MDDKLLTTEEIAEWLQVARTTVWRWRKNGLPTIKFKNSVRFDKEEVLKWLKENQKD